MKLYNYEKVKLNSISNKIRYQKNSNFYNNRNCIIIKIDLNIFSKFKNIYIFIIISF